MSQPGPASPRAGGGRAKHKPVLPAKAGYNRLHISNTFDTGA